MFNKPNLNNHRGQILILAIVFLFLLLSASLVLLGYVFSTRSFINRMSQENKVFAFAQAGIDKAIWCLNQESGENCSGTYGENFTGETDVILEDGSFSTEVEGTGNTRTITSTGKFLNTQKILKTKVTTEPATAETTFSYAGQSSEGGIYLSPGAWIRHKSILKSTDVHSNGNVEGVSAIITGNVYATGTITPWPRLIVIGTRNEGQEPKPLPEINTSFWEEKAARGGVITPPSGTYTSGAEEILGPVKIKGNLILAEDITIEGPIYVMGNIDTTNNITITLNNGDTSYDYTIIAEGKIIISNNVTINDTGTGGYLFFISKNDSLEYTDPAIFVKKAAGSAFYSLNGLVRLKNNVEVKETCAKRIYLDNNAKIYYETEIEDTVFATDPGNFWRFQRGTLQKVKN